MRYLLACMVIFLIACGNESETGPSTEQISTAFSSCSEGLTDEMWQEAEDAVADLSCLTPEDTTILRSFTYNPSTAVSLSDLQVEYYSFDSQGELVDYTDQVPYLSTAQGLKYELEINNSEAQALLSCFVLTTPDGDERAPRLQAECPAIGREFVTIQ